MKITNYAFTNIGYRLANLWTDGLEGSGLCIRLSLLTFGNKV